MAEQNLPELAERVEKATGSDPALDKDIHEALGNCVHRQTERYAVQSDTGFTCVACHEDMYGAKREPRYTSSVDAAITLVPEGCHWGLGFDAGGKGWAWVAYRTAGAWQTTPSIWAGTPALALTVACLRARAAMGNEAITLAMCGPQCDHDFHGPASYERNVDNGEGLIVGAERVCGKCGIGAMAASK